MSEAQDQIALIDQRIRANRQMSRSMGTIQTREPVGPGAYALFDGSTVGVPVKVPGTVFAQPGDRVTLDLYGTDWIVTSSFNSSSLGTLTSQQFGSSSAATTTSSSYADLSDITPVVFTKVYDDTRIRMTVSPAGYAQTATNTGARFGLRMTPLDPGSTYTPVDYELGQIFFSQTGMHMSGSSGCQAIAGIPNGQYSCQVRWKRYTGTGSINCNNFDLFVIEMDELAQGYIPPA